MRQVHKYLLTILATLCLFSAEAQDTIPKKDFVPLFEKNKTYEIRSNMGKVYSGRVIEETELEIIVLNEAQNMKYILTKKEIEEIQEINVATPQDPVNNASNTSEDFTPQFEKGKYYEITTVHGTKFRGNVSEETKTTIVVRDKRSNAKHTINKSEIKEVKTVNGRTPAAARFDDNYYSNFYMLTENALPFEKSSIIATTHLVLENITYSFNEHWAITTNVLIFLPISVGVKCSYEISKDLYFGASTYAYALPTDSSGYNVPFIGGIARVTKGDNNRNFTLSAGGILVDNEDVHTQGRSTKYVPVYYVNFAYANRFANRWVFNIENFLFPQAFSNPRGSVNLNLTGLSFKWVRNRDVQWNFGCYGLYLGDLAKLGSNSKIFPLPYISYTQFLR